MYEVVVRTKEMRSTGQRKQQTPVLSCERSGPVQMEMAAPTFCRALRPGRPREVRCHAVEMSLPVLGAGRSSCGVNAGVGARRMIHRDRRLGVALVNPVQLQ